MLKQSILSLPMMITLAAGTARAQEVPVNPPTPFELASGLDLECRPAQGAPPAPQVGVRQLNPVLMPKIDPQLAQLGPLEEVCVPVVKNGQFPPPTPWPSIAGSTWPATRPRRPPSTWR